MLRRGFHFDEVVQGAAAAGAVSGDEVDEGCALKKLQQGFDGDGVGQELAGEWASAGLLIALPGMFGEAVLLSRFAAFMLRMRPETAGRYGAFLFATYGVFLTIAEIVTMR